MGGHRQRIRACLAVGLLVLVVGTTGRIAVGGEREATLPVSAPAGEGVLAVPVVRGQAEFRVRYPERGGVLVVASALAQEGGPFGMTMQAELTDEADPLPSWTMPRLAPGGDSARIAAGSADPTSSEPRAMPPLSREFWLPIRPGAPADASRYVPIQARRVHVGRRIQVYVDTRDLDRVDPALPTMLVATFDNEIWPRSAARWGLARDVDGDGRFTVLLTRWLGHLPRPGEPVEGCFRGADFDPGLAPPFGNRCDMVTLDAALAAGSHAQTVLIHEYAHAVLFTRRVLSEPGVAQAAEDEAGWLDEAIAHLVEDDHTRSHTNLDHRLAAYQATPEAFGLVLADNPGDVAFAAGGGNRGAATLFLRWCAAGMPDRDDFLRRLAQPGACGVANVERATGVPFDALFRGWSVSQFLAPEAIGSARPAAVIVTAGGSSHHWHARPTSAHYAIVAPGENAGSFVRIRIEAPPEADLQVSTVPLAAGSIDIDRHANPERTAVDTRHRPEHSNRPVDSRARTNRSD